MTSLNTHIPLEYVQQSKKLQELKTEKLHYFNAGEWTGAYVDSDIYEEVDDDFRKHKLISAPTIADVIDNAEMLFDTYYNYDQMKIIYMCNEDKSIQEISEYIIKNIKE